MDAIKSTYYNTQTGFKGKTKLYKELKKQGYNQQQVAEFLNNQALYQLHKEAKRKHQKIIVDVPKKHYQIDLVDMSNYGLRNKGYNWILTMIDKFTRKAFTTPLKNKTDYEVLQGLKSIIDGNNLKPIVIQSDNGSEFTNNEIQRYFNNNQIFHSTSLPYTPETNGGIERFNKTIKSMIMKYFTLSNNVVWVDELQNLTKNYNNTEHSAIGVAPNDVNNNNKDKVLEFMEDKMYNKKITNKKHFDPGDRVRILKKKDTFEKKITETFTDKIYTIAIRKPGIDGLIFDQYALKNDKGEILKQQFIYSQLQLVGSATHLPNKERKIFEKEIKDSKKLASELGTNKETQYQSIQNVKEGKAPELPKRLKPDRPKRESKKPERYKP
jgi:hypothetical protein